MFVFGGHEGTVFQSFDEHEIDYGGGGHASEQCNAVFHLFRVVEREELLNEIWGYDFIGESRALDVHIRALRSKLNDDGHKYIKTIRSVGYRFYEEGDGSE